MAVLGLRFCARAFSSCGKRGPLFIAVRGPLTIAASLVAEHRLQTRRLSNCGSRAQLLRGMWDLPRPGLKPVSPALAGRLSTTAPPGKPHLFILAVTCINRIYVQCAPCPVTKLLMLLGTWAAELTPSSLRDAVSVPREGVEQVSMEYWVTLNSAQTMGFGIDTCLTQGLSVKVTENFVADFRTWISKDMESCSQSVCHGNSGACKGSDLAERGRRTDT